MKRILLLICVLAVSGAQALAQEKVPGLRVAAADEVQVVHMRDGSQIIGRITAIEAGKVTLVSDLGTVTISADRISKVITSRKSRMREGRYWHENPNATRLFFAPTGRMLKQGKGYFSDVWVFFPGALYGVTDRFSMGGGISIVPGIAMTDQIYYLTPKVGIVQQPSTNIAAGMLFIGSGVDESFTAGILYAVGTWGSTDNSFTAGFGYGFVNDELADKPAILLGFERRLTSRIGFVSENYVIPEWDNQLISYGFRFFGESMAVDLAMYSPIGEDAFFPGLPYVDFVFNF